MDLAEVDLTDPERFVEAVPHEMFELLRREAPVYRHPLPGGGHYWAVTSHADVVTVNRDSQTFSSWEGTAIFGVPEDNIEQQRLMMINMDPPEHTKLRKIVNKGFTPRMIRGLMDHLAEEARGIVAAAVEKGECDFVTDVACELPLIAIAEFLGVPVEDRKTIFDLTNRMIGNSDPEFSTNMTDAGEAALEMYAYAEALAAERRTNPQDDIVTALLNAEVDGEHLSDLEFNLFFMLLAVAGNETTRNAISHGAHALMEHPDQLALLRADEGLLDEALEELLRWASPVMNFQRMTTRPVELGGQHIDAGDIVTMWHISANRDETVFEDPYRFDIRRSPNLHTLQVAFGGGGPHFCLGANLARAEMKVIFSELLRQTSDWELLGPPSRLRSNFINGIKHMPVRFTPAA